MRPDENKPTIGLPSTINVPKIVEPPTFPLSTEDLRYAVVNGGNSILILTVSLATARQYRDEGYPKGRIINIKTGEVL